MEGFNEAVKKRLKEMGKDVSYLAEKLGVTQQHVYSLFRGDRRWNETLINKTCVVLEIDVTFQVKEDKPDEKDCTL